MKVIRKDAAIVDTSADTDFPGTFDVILSTPEEDRDGDVLLPDDWELPLPDHITFDMDHGMTVAATVGSGVPSIDEATGNLVVSGSYTSLLRGQETRTLVKEGHIKTVSVAFMTKPGRTKAGGTTVKRELLNGAFVAVPSNRGALVAASKALAGAKAGARNSATDAATIQAMHDSTVELGADCAAVKAMRGGARLKSIAGSLEAVQDRIRDALNDTYGASSWVWLRATLPGESGGVCVYEVDPPEGSDTEIWQESYADDGSVVTLAGDRKPVDLVEMIQADPDEETQSTSVEAPAAPAKAAPAPASGAPDEAEIQVRAARIRAMSALHSD